jgi:hypothetical protein
MATTSTITAKRGTKLTLNFTMSPVVDISGRTIVFTVAHRANSETKLIQVGATVVSGSAGTFQAIVPSASMDLAPGHHYFDASCTDIGLEATYANGPFVIEGIALKPAGTVPAAEVLSTYWSRVGTMLTPTASADGIDIPATATYAYKSNQTLGYASYHAGTAPSYFGGNVTLPTMTPGGTTGVYAGTAPLVQLFQAAIGAGGQSQGRNVFVGGAGNATMTNGAGGVALASNNTAVGYVALAANTSGFMNVAVGTRALGANTTGQYNVAIGEGTLLNATDAIGNVACGTSALYTLTSGNLNTAIGHDALEFLQTGTLNTSVGHRTNWQMTSGSSDTALGANALYSNLTGIGNTAVGATAMYYLTTGSSNVAVGSAALNANTTGGNNTAVGAASLLSMVGDAYAVACGADAGRYLANGSTPLTSAALSVFLGGLTKSKADSQSNEIVIGYGAVGAGSNTAVLGGASITDVYLGSATAAAGIHAATATITGGFGCNTKTAQTAYASGGALAAYGTGAFGLDSGANMSALHAMVVSMRAALVANGIMS